MLQALKISSSLKSVNENFLVQIHHRRRPCRRWEHN